MSLCYQKNDGFSLIDTLVAITLISVLAMFSIQAIVTYFSHRKQYLFMQQLYDDLKYTRIEAIVLNQTIRLSSDGNWCHGWLIINQQSQHVVKQRDGIAFCAIKFSTFPQVNYVQFLPNGNSDNQNVTFSFYDQHQKTMSIIVNQAGRVRFELATA